MTLRQFREYRTNIDTRTDNLVDAAHEVATKQLIPQIAKMSRNAVTVDRTEMYFYRRKRTGRRCSCFSVESAPDGACPVCTGYGIVGGFEKYGCHDELVDATRPDLKTLNLRLAPELMKTPVMFVLDEDAKSGYLECEIQVKANSKQVDTIILDKAIPDPRKSKVTVLIKKPADSGFSKLTDATLSEALYGKSFTVRIVFERTTLTAPSPLLSHLRLRYRLIDHPRVWVDIPRRQESVILQENFGVADVSTTINVFLPDTVRKITTEDFFVMVEEGTKWKVVESNPNKPGNQLTSHDVTCQLVQSFHPVYNFPV